MNIAFKQPEYFKFVDNEFDAIIGIPINLNDDPAKLTEILRIYSMQNDISFLLSFVLNSTDRNDLSKVSGFRSKFIELEATFPFLNISCTSQIFNDKNFSLFRKHSLKDPYDFLRLNYSHTFDYDNLFFVTSDSDVIDLPSDFLKRSKHNFNFRNQVDVIKGHPISQDIENDYPTINAYLNMQALYNLHKFKIYKSCTLQSSLIAVRANAMIRDTFPYAENKKISETRTLLYSIQGRNKNSEILLLHPAVSYIDTPGDRYVHTFNNDIKFSDKKETYHADINPNYSYAPFDKERLESEISIFTKDEQIMESIFKKHKFRVSHGELIGNYGILEMNQLDFLKEVFPKIKIKKPVVFNLNVK